ncbi:hypothetical protein ACJRO7_026380 [Eucalyptus globulus]|uniref:Uncharacterized protein n=1 Tax=Eucalyptus globulus TaxID=34317 RepID=A0ABD3JML9_EUCGL
MTSSSSSCFAPFRLWPVKTRVAAAKREEIGRAPFGERREGQEDQGGVFRSAASRICTNLKKVKQQPVSPGGRLVSFINSIFSATPKSPRSRGKASSSASTFSTVSSLSRPRLRKRSPSTRERFRRSGAKRTVRFYPVSVIVDEDCRPCGHKCPHRGGFTAGFLVEREQERRRGRAEGRESSKENIAIVSHPPESHRSPQRPTRTR